MNSIKQFIIQLAYGWVSKEHEKFCDDLDWKKEDSLALDDFLKSESGQKFLAMMGENSNRALRQVMSAKNDEEVRSVKAQAKVWSSLHGNMKALRLQRKDPKATKLPPEKLEEIFSKMVSSSIQVTRHAMK